MDDSLRRQARTARARITTGELRGRALLDLLRSVPFGDRDVWVDELLGIEGVPPDIPDLPRGAVPFLPCGVEEILAMISEVPLREDDELVDLGSGLGRVVLLAHLVSGARACGVEIQEHLVRSARDRAADLAVRGVSFIQADAAEEKVDGSVFFLYAPFNGEMLTRAVRRLHEVAARRPIVLCAVGIELPHESWLVPKPTSNAAMTLYYSRMPGGLSRLPRASALG